MKRSGPLMGTIVTIEIVGDDGQEASAAIERGFEWFLEVEQRCSRFDPESELRQVTMRVGSPVVVSEVLLAAVGFSVAVAEETAGAFDPTVGAEMEARGFDRDYRTGESTGSGIGHERATFRDVRVDQEAKTITLTRPLVLDLGAVAKGLAIDLAARELMGFSNFAIDAGGDLYLAGRNAGGDSWRVGIRHPRRDREAIETIVVSNAAVCTSGDYERPGHIVQVPQVPQVASATVIAPTALLADAMATAAFVLGPVRGIKLLERQGLQGVIFTDELERHCTRGYDALLSHA